VTAVTGTAVPARDTTVDGQDVDLEEGTEPDDDVTVPAAPRHVTRQQRVTGSAQRRPGANKKKRR
jgi:hypothetical protein